MQFQYGTALPAPGGRQKRVVCARELGDPADLIKFVDGTRGGPSLGDPENDDDDSDSGSKKPPGVVLAAQETSSAMLANEREDGSGGSCYQPADRTIRRGVVICYEWDGTRATCQWLGPMPPPSAYMDEHRQKAFREFLERLKRYALEPKRALDHATQKLTDTTPTGRVTWAAWVKTDEQRKGVVRA